MWLQPISSSTKRRHEKHRCHPFVCAVVWSCWRAVSWGQSPVCSANLQIAQVTALQSGQDALSPLILAGGMKVEHVGALQ
jgi:hypothetical protein